MISDSNTSFGELHFGHAELGDTRRTNRLVYCADCLCRHPGGSLPDKFKSPADLKAFYRLCDSEGVTHEAILRAHRDHVLQEIAALRRDLLVIHDSTELDYTTHHSLNQLGQIGNGNQRGYICHNSLLVDPKSRDVMGLMNQILHRRAKTPKKETTAERRNRETRESRLWVEGTKPIPPRHQLIDVCDQGADVFEFLAHEFSSGRRFVIRAAYDRRIFIGHDNADETGLLRQYASTLPAIGQRVVSVTHRKTVISPKKKGRKRKSIRKAREAITSIAAAPVQVRPPQTKTGCYDNQPLILWIIRVWEPNPPQGQEPLEWFLLTNEPVETYEKACRVIHWYECRWIVEEYHKAMKTGCGIEHPQFANEERLQPAIALISIVALKLLSLRDASRRHDAKKRPATDLISFDYVEVLSLWRHKKVCREWTVHEFFHALARLGGHQNRRSDKQPGWLVLWRGWTTLQAMLQGALTIQLLRKCGQT